MELNYLSIAVAVFFLICIAQGYRKGFLRQAISLASMLAVILAVLFVSPYVSRYLKERTNAYEAIREQIVTAFAEDNAKLDNTDPQNQRQTIDSYDIPALIKDALSQNNTGEMYRKLMVEIFEEYVAGYMADLIIKAASFAGLFLVLMMITGAALRASDLINKIPVLKGFNRFLGVFAGAIKALLFIWIFFIVAVTLLGHDIGSTLMREVGRSPFLTFLFNENILLELIAVGKNIGS